jgi:hypothetical protein
LPRSDNEGYSSATPHLVDRRIVETGDKACKLDSPGGFEFRALYDAPIGALFSFARAVISSPCILEC